MFNYDDVYVEIMIAILLRVFPVIFNFYLFSDGLLEMQMTRKTE